MDERAFAELRGPVCQPAENSGLGPASFADASRWVATGRDRSEIKPILRRLGLSMTKISALTSLRYGKATPYFIPPTFHRRLRQGITPHLCQIVALSQITGYRFSDWMKIFGFDLTWILVLQLKLHRERTAIITPGAADAANNSGTSEWNWNGGKPKGRYLFAKIGRRDAVLYPGLVPGSIVRVDRSQRPPVHNNGSLDQRMWLVEHAAGLTCCHVKCVDPERIMLLPNCPPVSPWPLRLSQEARVLGLVDLVFQPRESVRFCPLTSRTTRDSLPSLPAENCSAPTLSRLLSISRSRAGLTLRAAHEMTRHVARLLGKRDYRISLGLLSDYEAINKIPRHVAKIISLSVVYGIDPYELVRAGGIQIDDSDKAPLSPNGQPKACLSQAQHSVSNGQAVLALVPV